MLWNPGRCLRFDLTNAEPGARRCNSSAAVVARPADTVVVTLACRVARCQRAGQFMVLGLDLAAGEHAASLPAERSACRNRSRLSPPARDREVWPTRRPALGPLAAGNCSSCPHGTSLLQSCEHAALIEPGRGGRRRTRPPQMPIGRHSPPPNPGGPRDDRAAGTGPGPGVLAGSAPSPRSSCAHFGSNAPGQRPGSAPSWGCPGANRRPLRGLFPTCSCPAYSHGEERSAAARLHASEFRGTGRDQPGARPPAAGPSTLCAAFEPAGAAVRNPVLLVID